LGRYRACARMSEGTEDLARVPDGGRLLRLPNGIVIVRRRKHEPVDLRGKSKTEIERLTGKVNGAKFLPQIDLECIVRMTREVLIEKDVHPGAAGRYTKGYGRPIGISRGRHVKGLCVVVSGRYAHAFPIDEKDLPP